MLVDFATSTRFINGPSVLDRYYIVRFFITISAVVALRVIGKRIVCAVARRVDDKDSPTLFGMALDDG